MSKDRKRPSGEPARTGADPAPSTDHGLLELDRKTSLELLAGVDVGRLAWDDGDRVMVFPLNFVLDGEYVYARTRSEAIFAAAAGGSRLTFQGDEFEPGVRGGWTVMVSGHAEEIVPGPEAERISELVKPWRENGTFRVLRLHVEDVSGRRLALRPGSIESVYVG